MSKRRILQLFASLFALNTLVCHGADFGYSNKNAFDGRLLPRGEVVLLSGPIEPGDTAKLIQFIKSDFDRFVKSAGLVLSSPGGDIQEAMLLARLVR